MRIPIFWSIPDQGVEGIFGVLSLASPTAPVPTFTMEFNTVYPFATWRIYSLNPISSASSVQLYARSRQLDSTTTLYTRLHFSPRDDTIVLSKIFSDGLHWPTGRSLFHSGLVSQAFGDPRHITPVDLVVSSAEKNPGPPCKFYSGCRSGGMGCNIFVIVPRCLWLPIL